MAPRVSVLLPCRNGAGTLTAALRSMLSQTLADFELLLLDDGSSDDSVRIAGALGDERIRILADGAHRGLAARLNEGVRASRGEYVARMDADDLSFPERLAKQAAFLDGQPRVDLVGCRAVVFAGSGAVIGLLPFAADHAALCARPWAGIPLPHPTWMGRREWFVAHPYRPGLRRAQDQELLLRAAPDSCYACLDEVLLGYRQDNFQLRRTLSTRRSLLAAQLGLFARRGQWGDAFKATALTGVKAAIDLLAALPGCEALFFKRMSEPASPAVVDTLRRLI